MRIVIALADDALHRKGGQGCAQEQALMMRSAAAQLARVADGNDIVIVHAEEHWAPPGPLAHNGHAGGEFMHDASDDATDADCRLELAVRNELPCGRACSTLRTTVEVDIADPSFDHPDRPVGGVFVGARALAAAQAKHWRVAQDGIGYRRVVPSPRPMRLVETPALHRLVEQGAVVVCAIGGVPVAAGGDGGLHDVEGVVDLYAGAELVAETIGADLFVIATGMAGVFLDWGTANSKLLRHGHPSVLHELDCAAGSMRPKLQAASHFAERMGRRAAIGAVTDIARVVEGTVGTTISCERVDPRAFAGGAVAC